MLSKVGNVVGLLLGFFVSRIFGAFEGLDMIFVGDVGASVREDVGTLVLGLVGSCVPDVGVGNEVFEHSGLLTHPLPTIQSHPENERHRVSLSISGHVSPTGITHSKFSAGLRVGNDVLEHSGLFPHFLKTGFQKHPLYETQFWADVNSGHVSVLGISHIPTIGDFVGVPVGGTNG